MEGTIYISRLLEHHDCVIIPGLGGFVGSYHPASIHPRYHTFQPPYKKLLFNVSLRHNDGLLADFIAREERIPFSEANEKVRIYAEECQSRLRLNKQVLIRDVGRLFMGLEGTIQFDQDLRHNLLAESFGLQPFFSVPVHKETITAEPATETPERIPVRTLSRKAVLRPLKWAALLAMPVGLAILLSISGFDQARTKGVTYADVLSVFIGNKTEPAAISPVAAVPRPVPHPMVNISPTHPAPAGEETVAVEPENPFAVIIGAFRIRENATNLISRLQSEGMNAALFDITPGGLHRVTAGTYAEREEAIAALRQVRSKGFEGAWLLVK